MSHPKTKSIIVLIGGGHAAGKKTTANLLKDEIDETLSDSHLELKVIDLNDYNSITHSYSPTSKSAAITVPSKSDLKYPTLKPSRFDFSKLKDELKDDLETEYGQAQKVNIIHGLYALYDKELRDLSRMKIFIASDPDTRLIRWIRRDVLDSSNDISLEEVINTYLQGSRAEMSNFIFPTKEYADVILPRGAELNGVRLMVDGLLPFLAYSRNSPDRVSYTSNYLRPSGNKVFQKERFDNQKGKFYELN